MQACLVYSMEMPSFGRDMQLEEFDNGKVCISNVKCKITRSVFHADGTEQKARTASLPLNNFIKVIKN